MYDILMIRIRRENIIRAMKARVRTLSRRAHALRVFEEARRRRTD